MDQILIERILDKLEKDLNIEESTDFIGELFEERADTIHSEIIKNKQYKKYIDEITKIDEQMKEKFSNYWDIVEIIEKSRNITYKNSDLCEKLMYKYGIYDGIKLILEGTKDIDISKTLKNGLKNV